MEGLKLQRALGTDMIYIDGSRRKVLAASIMEIQVVKYSFFFFFFFF